MQIPNELLILRHLADAEAAGRDANIVVEGLGEVIRYGLAAQDRGPLRSGVHPLWLTARGRARLEELTGELEAPDTLTPAEELELENARDMPDPPELDEHWAPAWYGDRGDT